MNSHRGSYVAEAARSTGHGDRGARGRVRREGARRRATRERTVADRDAAAQSVAEATGRIKTSAIAYKQYEEQKKLLLKNMATSVAQIPFLKATLSIQELDQETINFTVEQVKQAIDIPRLLILNSKGEIIAASKSNIFVFKCII